MLTFTNNSCPQPQITDADHSWISRIELLPPMGQPHYTERQQAIIGQFAVASPESAIQQVSLGLREDARSLSLVYRLEADNPTAAITTLVDTVYGGLKEADIPPRRTAISRLHMATVQDLLDPCSILQSANHQYTRPAVRAFDAAQSFYDDYDRYIPTILAQ